MKFLFTIAATVALAFNCLATGPLPLNSLQSGVVSFSTNSPAYMSVTNTFEPGFTYLPAMSFYLVAGPTNALPFTNTVTTTNFVLTIATSTNCSVAWVANPPYFVMESGSVVASAVLNTNITFPVAYAAPPTVILTGSVLVTNPVVTSVTTTTANISVCASNTVYWLSFGPQASPAQNGPNGTAGYITH